MDLLSIMSALMGSSSTNNISKATGTSTSDVTSILSSALPLLLTGVNNQASSSSTATSFANALASHSQDNTSNLASFFNTAEMEDGSKIIKHLFGSQTTAATKAIAKEAGVTQAQASSVLSAAAPYFMSLMGQQTEAETQKATTQAAKTSATSSLISSLLGNADITSLAGTLLSSALTSGATSSAKKTTTKKTTTAKKSGVDLSDGLDVNDVVGLLGALLK